VTVEQEAFAALERKLIEEKARLQKEAENQVARVNAAAVVEAGDVGLSNVHWVIRCAPSLRRGRRKCTRSWTQQPRGSSSRTGDVSCLTCDA
jgi:hypothetical protein